MGVRSFAYIGMTAADPAAWTGFARDVLGLGVSKPSKDGTQYLTTDGRRFRIAVVPGKVTETVFLGWLVDNDSDLHMFRERLAAADVSVQEGSEDECVERDVERLIHFRDPDGRRVELVHGLRFQDPADPVSAPASNLVALGHSVLGTGNLKAVEAFYCNLLDFRVSDYIDFEMGGHPVNAAFFRVADGRHHSMALASAGPSLNHIMIEVKTIDDVGLVYDRCKARGVPIARALGRHSNDFMFSFYMVTPNGVMLECGYGGIVVKDDQAWKVKRLDRISVWGHEVLGH